MTLAKSRDEIHAVRCDARPCQRLVELAEILLRWKRGGSRPRGCLAGAWRRPRWRGRWGSVGPRPIGGITTWRGKGQRALKAVGRAGRKPRLTPRQVTEVEA